MIFKYYDESYIRVKAIEWTTDWIHCGIVFQWCPLSCILFLAVLNLCLNLHDEYSQLGYCILSSDHITNKELYGDLPKITKRISQRRLQFAGHCKRSEGKIISNLVTWRWDCQYPQSANAIPWETDLWRPKGPSHQTICERQTRRYIKKSQISFNSIQQRSHTQMTWKFTLHNFPITYVENLGAICTKYLKRWAGISRCTTNTALYRSRKKYGLQLKRLTTSVKCMQVTKYHLNKHSVHGSTQVLYKDRIQKKAKQVRWNGVK